MLGVVDCPKVPGKIEEEALFGARRLPLRFGQALKERPDVDLQRLGDVV